MNLSEKENLNLDYDQFVIFERDLPYNSQS